MKARDTGMGRGNFRKKQAGKSTLLALVIEEKDGVLEDQGDKRSCQLTQHLCLLKYTLFHLKNEGTPQKHLKQAFLGLKAAHVEFIQCCDDAGLVPCPYPLLSTGWEPMIRGAIGSLCIAMVPSTVTDTFIPSERGTAGGNRRKTQQ